MTLLDEVVMWNCSDVYHYLLNKIRYIKKNPQDHNEKENIKRDLSDIENGQQILICASQNQRIEDLNLELLSHLK